MVSMVAAGWNAIDEVGGVFTRNGAYGANGTAAEDIAVGAFTGLTGLPEDVASEEELDSFALQLLFKEDELNDAGIEVVGAITRRFFGVGAGGDDVFAVQNAGEGEIYGRGGDDWLQSLTGANDSLNGGDGADTLNGGGGDNTLLGGLGDDTLVSGAGNDAMFGSAGLDTADYAAAGEGLVVNLAATGLQDTGAAGIDLLSGIETVTGGAHGDNLSGDGWANRVEGRGGDDTLWGGDGSDTLQGGAGDDGLHGGSGDDWASYAGSPGMTVDLAVDSATVRLDPGSENDVLAEIEAVLGSSNPDELRGDEGRNTLLGGAGDDLIAGDGYGDDVVLGGADALDGGLGDDQVDGGRGDDVITGFDGADVLAGGEGDDTMLGGAGRDTADYRLAAAGVTVRLSVVGGQDTGGAGSDDLFGIESLLGSAYRDALTGDAEGNRLDGRGGRDALSGGFGADTLVGAAGKDVLTGGESGDVMTGGVGKDRYVYASMAESQKTEVDLITDLTGEDRILLTDIDANANKAGNQAFDLVDALTGKAGQAALVYDAASDRTRLLLDTDGDAKADGTILFAGDHTDFVNFAL